MYYQNRVGYRTSLSLVLAASKAPVDKLLKAWNSNM